MCFQQLLQTILDFCSPFFRGSRPPRKVNSFNFSDLTILPGSRGYPANHLYYHQYSLRKTSRCGVRTSSSPQRFPPRFGHSSYPTDDPGGCPIPRQPLTSQSKLEPRCLVKSNSCPFSYRQEKILQIWLCHFLPVGKPGLQVYDFQLTDCTLAQAAATRRMYELESSKSGDESPHSKTSVRTTISH